MWDEESRAQFIKRLSDNGPYKHHTEVLGGSAIGTSIDALAAALLPIMGPVPLFLLKQLTGLLKTSGLLLFSRHPFVKISDGSFCEFVKYKDGALPDSMAPKGGAAVVISPQGFRNIVIGFTHLQADYKDQSNPGIRLKQIQQWWDLMKDVAQKTQSPRFIACGDLNIIGNVDETKPSEYHDIFESDHPFSVILHDQWLESHSKADLFLTHPGDSQRLDYMLTGTWGADAPISSFPQSATICAHHLMLAKNLWSGPPQVQTPFSEPGMLARGGGAKLSDHIGINAVINFHTPFCMPKAAMLVAVPGDKATVAFTLASGGAYHWFQIDRKGTAFLKVQMQDVEVMAFDPTDLSSGRTPVEPPDWPAPEQRLLGSRFSLPVAPAFVRVRQLHPVGNAVSGSFTVTMANGQSKKMSQYLEGSTDYVLGFPDAVLNEDDTMWCEALPNVPTPAQSHQTIQVTLKWNAKGNTPPAPFELRVEDSAGKVLGKTLCNNPKGNIVKLPLDKVGYIYPKVKRLGKNAPPFTLRWDSNLTLLHGPSFAGRAVPGAGPLELECTDETDSDWLGSDEPILRVTIDGILVRKQSYEDVDSGDIVSVDQIAPIAYLKGLSVHLEEGSDKTDQAQPPLSPNTSHELGKTMYLDVGDGNYELHHNLSHWLESSPAAKQGS